MEQLLRDQLRDENPVRVWGRTVLDLLLTVPSLRLEAHMSARSSAPVYGAAAVASSALAVIAGSAVGVGLIGVAGVLVFGGLAVVAWGRARALGDGGHAAAHWWKYLAAGAAGFVGAVVWVNVGEGTLGENGWALFMGVLLTSVVLMAVGVALGITRAVGRRTA